jgi:uncharacterized protein (UPF0335 family)
MAKTLKSELPDKFGGVVNQDTLRRGVENIAHLLDRRAEINAEIKAEKETLKEAGFVPKHISTVVREYRMDADERADMYTTLENYRRGLGMLDGTPLGDAAMEREETVRAAPKPRSFAEQPLRRPRGRPRKAAGEALAGARLHLGEEKPAGTA